MFETTPPICWFSFFSPMLFWFWIGPRWDSLQMDPGSTVPWANPWRDTWCWHVQNDMTWLNMMIPPTMCDTKMCMKLNVSKSPLYFYSVQFQDVDRVSGFWPIAISQRLFNDLHRRELEASLISYNSAISAGGQANDPWQKLFQMRNSEPIFLPPELFWNLIFNISTSIEIPLDSHTQNWLRNGRKHWNYWQNLRRNWSSLMRLGFCRGSVYVPNRFRRPNC